ncbi:MAG: sporulation peptidase YabG [Peptococcaceae bacterium]|nr:sporulation peptidase YabG [Peptococcaceae bacterium]
MLEKGDIVARRSYNEDLFLKVEDMEVSRGEKIAHLSGLIYRLSADSGLDDLCLKTQQQVVHYHLADSQETYQKFRKLAFARKFHKPEEYFEVPPQVLHMDGDEEYLEQCLSAYRRLGVKAQGLRCPEHRHAEALKKTLSERHTDILVLTGHDSFKKKQGNREDMDAYRSSRHFVRAVKAAREIQPHKDQLIIFAGGCQSHFEAIIEAGANFASSPKRMLIHALDPVFIVESIVRTPMDKIVSLKEMLNHTITGTDGVGGIETLGKLRRGYPWTEYDFSKTPS